MKKQLEFKPTMFIYIMLLIYLCVLIFKFSLFINYHIITYGTLFYDGFVGDVIRIPLLIACLTCFKSKKESDIEKTNAN